MSELNADPTKIAEDLGLDIVFPQENEIFIDLDDEAEFLHLEKMLNVLESNGFYFVITKTTTSPGGNRHVYIKTLSFHRLEPLQRVAFQACLGSDRKRELLSVLRTMSGTRPPTVFFEKKEQHAEAATEAVP